MDMLKRIRGSGSHRADTIAKQEQQQKKSASLQGQRVASLVSQPQSSPPTPVPPPPPSRPNHPSARPTKLQLEAKEPVKQQPEARAPLNQPTLPSAGRRQQHPQPKFPPIETRSDNTSSKSNNTAKMSEPAIISQVYGPNANIYTDVLSVSPTASSQEIREAFFFLRYGIYQQLSGEGDAHGPLSEEERKKVEMKMDAISAAFQILSDRNKRAMYDNTLAQKQGRGGGSIPASMRDSPSKEQSQPPLSVGQKRSNYRRQMNAQQRRPIQVAMNERKAPAPVFVGEETVEKEEEGTRGKQMSIKTTEEAIGQHQDEGESPTGVEEFESMNKFKNIKLDGNKSSSNRERDSPEPDDDDRTDERTYDDDTRDSRTYGTYDDDSRTYGTYDDGEESYYTYGDATYGTYDDSTYVTYDDDQTYETYDDERGKHSPSHKTGDKPEPILKGSTPKGKKSKKSSDRRVRIHSHRGRGENGEEGCPFPAFEDTFEELSGTYADFKNTLNQVGTAFIISPDDIDKMSDKLRDAGVELVETYEKQQAAQNQQKVKKGVKLPKQSKKAVKN